MNYQDIINSIKPQVGSWVKFDNWCVGTTLQQSQWDDVEFMVPSASMKNVHFHANITVTGRTIQEQFGQRVIRIRAEVPSDGEGKAVVMSGWMGVN